MAAKEICMEAERWCDLLRHNYGPEQMGVYLDHLSAATGRIKDDAVCEIRDFQKLSSDLTKVSQTI